MIESQVTLLIGVDGGGTGCRVAIADGNRRVLATAEGGRANVATDFDLALRCIRDTIDLAAQKVGIMPDILAVATVHMGLAGVVSDEVAARVASVAGFKQITVTDDRPTAVAGALAGKDGFLVSVGTGTIIASHRAGRSAFVGGYGFYVSDQASGAWLGRRLLEETLLCYDGVRPHTELTRASMAKFGDDPCQIAGFSIASGPGDYGGLAPDVVDAAQAGDTLGTALMQEGFAYLEAGLKALRFQPDDKLCLTGGVGRHYLSHFAAQAAGNIIESSGSSVSGAIHLAAVAAGQAIEASS